MLSWNVNCGTLVRNEPEIMAWLVNLVKEAVDLPLCIDSPNPKALEVGLELAAERGQPMVNSISAEAERYNSVLPLVLKNPVRSIRRWPRRRVSTPWKRPFPGLF